MKKIILSILVLLLAVSLLGFACAATIASGACGDNAQWNLDSTGVLTISGTGKMQDFSSYGSNLPPWNDHRSSITSVVVEDGVTTIGDYAFNAYSRLTSVTLEDSVEYIYDYAFQDCTSLSSISLSSKLWYIGEECFRGCTALTGIALPESLSTISDEAFRDCTNLAEIYLPDKVREIDSGVFRSSGIKKVSISPKLTSVGLWAFQDCKNLTEIRFRGDSPNGQWGFGFRDDCFKNVTATAYYPLTNNTWTSDCFDNYGGNITWKGYGGFDFGELAPSGTCGKGLTWKITAEGELVISGVGDMDDYVVMDTPNDAYAPWYEYASGIKTVTIENGVTSIGDGAFFRCINLTDIDIPTSIMRIGKDVFSFCTSLKHFSIPAGLDVVPAYLFYECEGLESVTIADGITAIGDSAFHGCANLKSITIPDSVTSIGALSFEYCSSLTEITIPDSVTSIGDWCFAGCTGLKTVKLSKRLETLPWQVFFLCHELENITIPAGITYIGEEVLGTYTSDWYGQNIRLEFTGEPPEFHENAFSYAAVTIRYPVNSTAWGNLAAEKAAFGASEITYESYFPKSSILDCDLTITPSSYFYDGTAKKPSITLTLYGKTLVQGTDYTVAFSNNTNAGSANITITGKGIFSDTMRGNFIIAPADPVLEFAESTVTKVEDAKAFTNTLVKATDGTVTFSSSNTKIATVDSATGKVTIVGPGTAVITASASAGKNYKLGFASYTLIVEKKQIIKDFTISDVTFSFSNSKKGLGITGKYEMPLSSFEMFLPPAKAKEMWYKYKTFGGYCYGFAVASGMFSADGSALDLDWFGKSKISDLKPTTYSSKINMNVLEMLGAAWISQLGSDSTYAHWVTRDDLEGLVELMKTVPYTGELVEIGIWSDQGGAHAVLGYKYEKINDSRARIYIYDNNRPNKECYITLTLDATGKHTGWLYEPSYGKYGTKYGNPGFDYAPYSVYNTEWANRGNGAFKNMSLMWIEGDDDFEIYDYAGNLLAEVEDTNLTSHSKSIYEIDLACYGIDSGETLIALPADIYTVENADGGSLDITVAHNQQSASVVTDASSATLYVIDDNAVNMVSVDAAADESYQIMLYSTLDSAEGMEEVKFCGFGSTAPVQLGMNSGDLYMANCVGVSLWINDVMYATASEEFQRNIAEHTIELDYAACGYDGTNKEPGVTVYNGSYTLERGKDFVVVYSNNVAIGTATATVYGIGSYSGSASRTFQILEPNGEACDLGHFWNSGELITNDGDEENGVMRYTCMVCGKTDDRPFRGYGFELGDNFDEYVDVRFINNLSYTIGGECCLVAYDADDNIVGFTTESVELNRGYYQTITLDFEPGVKAVSVKAFVIDPDTFAPLCPAWESSL